MRNLVDLWSWPLVGGRGDLWVELGDVASLLKLSPVVRARVLRHMEAPKISGELFGHTRLLWRDAPQLLHY